MGATVLSQYAPAAAPRLRSGKHAPAVRATDVVLLTAFEGGSTGLKVIIWDRLPCRWTGLLGGGHHCDWAASVQRFLWSWNFLKGALVLELWLLYRLDIGKLFGHLLEFKFVKAASAR